MKYYPEELSDWWMDDWISTVYGPQHTYMSRSIRIAPHMNQHGKRYNVNYTHNKMLVDLVNHGIKTVKTWTIKHGLKYEDDYSHRWQLEKYPFKELNRVPGYRFVYKDVNINKVR